MNGSAALSEKSIKQNGTVVITNWLDNAAQTETLSYWKFFPSPVNDYAVMMTNRGLIAVVLTEASEDTLKAVYVDLYKPDADDDMLCGRFYSIDWSNIGYGFAKVEGFEMDTGRTQTVCRFYFDVELYIRKYEEKNGIPYSGHKAFKVTQTTAGR